MISLTAAGMLDRGFNYAIHMLLAKTKLQPKTILRSDDQIKGDVVDGNQIHINGDVIIPKGSKIYSPLVIHGNLWNHGTAHHLVRVDGNIINYGTIVNVDSCGTEEHYFDNGAVAVNVCCLGQFNNQAGAKVVGELLTRRVSSRGGEFLDSILVVGDDTDVLLSRSFMTQCKFVDLNGKMVRVISVLEIPPKVTDFANASVATEKLDLNDELHERLYFKACEAGLIQIASEEEGLDDPIQGHHDEPGHSAQHRGEIIEVQHKVTDEKDVASAPVEEDSDLPASVDTVEASDEIEEAEVLDTQAQSVVKEAAQAEPSAKNVRPAVQEPGDIIKRLFGRSCVSAEIVEQVNIFFGFDLKVLEELLITLEKDNQFEIERLTSIAERLTEIFEEVSSKDQNIQDILGILSKLNLERMQSIEPLPTLLEQIKSVIAELSAPAISPEDLDDIDLE